MKPTLLLLVLSSLALTARADSANQLTLATPINYTLAVGPGQTATVTLNTITLVEVIDRPEDKVVIAYVDEFQQPVTLYAKAAYDAAGTWTQASLLTRLQSILNGTVTDPSAVPAGS